MYRLNEATKDAIREHWHKRHHIGSSTPFVRVWVRSAWLRRRWMEGKVYAKVPGLTTGGRIWAGVWEPGSDYVELPSVGEISLETDFEANGVTTATIQMENVAFVEQSGVAGMYHTIERGYYAPLRGYKPKGRAKIAQKNEWFDKLNDKSTEIVVVAGYGDKGIPVFKGLVNDNDGEPSPDRFTITARDMGQFLTDQRCIGGAKIRDVPDPITFYDERRARRKFTPEELRKYQYLLVNDAADIIRTVFQWCGFTEWEVETTGVRLKEKLVFNRGDYLIDIIRKICELTNYVFYMKPPRKFDEDDLSPENEDNMSMGIPVFRSNQALRSANAALDGVEEVREDSLLTGFRYRFTDEPLAFAIRVRGKESKKRGKILWGDKTKRIHAVYKPPWSRSELPLRNGNVKKQVVHHNPMLETGAECRAACRIIAFREALESATATAEFPALPWIHLDHQLRVRDAGTGMATRLWLTNRIMRIRTGKSPEFKMSVGGSLIDTRDIENVRTDLKNAIQNAKEEARD